MTKKGWLIFSGLILAALVAAIYMSKQNEVVLPDATDPLVIQKAITNNGNIGDHTYGKLDSKVVLIEYGDFQCPGCGVAAPIMQKLSEKYKDKMLLIFRNRLLSYHANARAAASFAEAAGLQGKYWEVHNKLYDTQSSWESLTGQERTDYFVNLLNQAGADGNKALSDIDSDAIKKKIAYDEALSTKQNVTATPSLFLNGKLVSTLDVKDGKTLIQSDNDSSTPAAWSDETYFDTLIIQPALKEAGLL